MSDEPSEFPLPRKVAQIVWVINTIYNDQWRRTINRTRISTLGDKLDAEKLLNASPSWTEIRKGNMKTPELFGWLKNKSLKTFATRDIFMNMLKSRDPRGLLFSFSTSSVLVEQMCQC